ncbi:hypothetical protein [Isoptericola sp. NPDC057559]
MSDAEKDDLPELTDAARRRIGLPSLRKVETDENGEPTAQELARQLLARS